MSMHNPESGQNRDNLDPKAHAREHSVQEGYEVSDANTGGVLVFLVGMGISIAVFFVFCFGMGKVINNALDRHDGPANKWNAPNQIAPRKAIQSNAALEQQQLAKLTQQFPTPRLETDDGNLDLAGLHDREDLLLHYYSWVDQGKGTVRIPIERAMEIIAQQGLPVAPQQQQQQLMVGDSKPVIQMPLTNGFAPTGYEQMVHSAAGEAGEQTSAHVDNQ